VPRGSSVALDSQVATIGRTRIERLSADIEIIKTGNVETLSFRLDDALTSAPKREKQSNDAPLEAPEIYDETQDSKT
jgi:hypothetical protein